MAEKTQFVIGSLGTDFLQEKTTDNIYLKDLLLQEIFPALAEYNNRTMALKELLCYEHDSAVANAKRMYNSDEFLEVGAIEQPQSLGSFEAWNVPVPIVRYGASTNMTMEVLKQMSSKQIIEWHNGKMVADQKNIVKQMFQSMCKKTPTSRVDALTSIAATPKAFWNDESGMDTPRANGQITFDGDHQHYLSVGTADSLGTNGSELDALIALISEHENMSGYPILWARTGATLNLIMNESTNFKPIKEIAAIIGAVNPAYNATGFVQALINGTKVMGWNVKAVGTWKGAVVVETPDIPEDYILCTMYTGNNSPWSPLAWRNHPNFRGLVMESGSMGNPVVGNDARYLRYLGCSVNERSAGGVLYVGNTSWAEPSFS